MQALNSSFKLFTALLVFAYALVSSAEDIKAGDILLSKLHDNTRVSTKDELGSFGMAILFQPKCPWCKKQIKELETLRHRCDFSTPSILIGINASKQALKRELNILNTKSTALHASAGFLRHAKVDAVAPSTLFFNQEGEVIHRHRGYIPKTQMSQVLANIENVHCDI